MRIVHVNLARGYRGGERQTELLIRELARTGCAQALWGRAGEPLLNRLQDIPHLERVALRPPYLGAFAASQPGDILHAHEGKATHVAHIVHRLQRRPYVITRRVPNRPKDGRWTRRVYRTAARVVAISGAVDAALRAWEPRLAPERIASVASRQSPDSRQVAALRARYTGPLRIGQVGALVDHHKGQRVLLDALRQKPALADYPVLLIGSGEDETALRHEAADLAQVVFTGFVENVADYLAALDVFVFPSREEGLGSTLIDAMVQGLPIVASRVGGIPELIEHERTGLLVPPGDAAALAAALARLTGDPDLRRRLGSAAQAAAAAYTPEAMAAAYLDLYHDIAQEHTA
ncbi:glycosyltransferase [Candidatus Macondimonas diazotrophica]|uniref:Glycosyltransferase family 1 protein n=1 Tax=Candidatus Macondimonas diazotrophica TaxID=2305248 RepID=A0A4Z0FCF3_9GAMM|nr:glycosyltransferase [Candidatus Macondimonas diazotrophica]NCU01585.1 glycosyltransferase [Candidatus Macondimonas diazotrophica]TFZ84216.1 glycosyltransferase family 1 protein [Candidatus Macondimonas diazotrophica]